MASLIDTLGKAARHEMMVVVRCRRCEREAKFLATELVAFYSPGRPLDSLPFKCRECSVGGDITVRPVDYRNDRTREIVVWRPTKMKI